PSAAGAASRTKHRSDLHSSQVAPRTSPGNDLTIHSSRRRFAARLNSGVRRDSYITIIWHKMIFATALAAGAISAIFATLLALRLAKALPALHESADAPSGREWTPFWILHFLRPSRWRQLPSALKPLALAAILGLMFSVAA